MSTNEQGTISQEIKAREYNIPIENVYIEKILYTNLTDRPALTHLMASLNSGDKLIVDSISKFARNIKDLLTLVNQLNKNGIIFVSLKETIDTTTSTGLFMFKIFEAMAQLERNYIKDKQDGKHKGRKSIEYPSQWDKYYKMMKAGNIKVIDVMKILDLKKTTLYKLINQYEEGK